MFNKIECYECWTIYINDDLDTMNYYLDSQAALDNFINSYKEQYQKEHSRVERLLHRIYKPKSTGHIPHILLTVDDICKERQLNIYLDLHRLYYQEKIKHGRPGHLYIPCDKFVQSSVPVFSLQYILDQFEALC